MHKKILNISRGGKYPPPLAHACGRPWLLQIAKKIGGMCKRRKREVRSATTNQFNWMCGSIRWSIVRKPKRDETRYRKSRQGVTMMSVDYNDTIPTPLCQ